MELNIDTLSFCIRQYNVDLCQQIELKVPVGSSSVLCGSTHKNQSLPPEIAGWNPDSPALLCSSSRLHWGRLSHDAATQTKGERLLIGRAYLKTKPLAHKYHTDWIIHRAFAETTWMRPFGFTVVRRLLCSIVWALVWNHITFVITTVAMTSHVSKC